MKYDQSALLKFHFGGDSEEGGWEEMGLMRIGKSFTLKYGVWDHVPR